MGRKLAAIMAADVVGYSRMMGEDETKTLSDLRKLRVETLEPEIASHGGTVVKQIGDGWLAEFPSSTEATNCAIAVQEKLAVQQKIQVRIGIHIGDIVHEDDGDIYGDGVNIACRLEGIAQPCGVAISDQLYASIGAKLRTVFVDSGKRRLKNISDAMQVWHWPKALARQSESTEGEYAIPIILVERFNQSGDVAGATDIADEFHGELIDALSHRPGIKVASQSHSSPTYVLKGRCRIAGTRCRFNLSMTVAANGETFWTTKIDGDATNIFSLLDDAVARIGGALRSQMNAYAGAAYASLPDETLTLQQLLAKAAFYFYHFSEPSSLLSRQTMEVAFARAPENPMVLTMRAYAIMQMVPHAIERAEDVDSEAAITYANKAIQLGPKIDIAFFVRAWVRLWLSRDHAGCCVDATKALTINPNYHLPQMAIAMAKIFGGQHEEGCEGLEESLRQDPAGLNTPHRLSILAIGQSMIGETEAALRNAINAYESRPETPVQAIAYAVSASGNPKITHSEQFRTMIRQAAITADDATRFPFASEADTQEIEKMLRNACLPG